MKSGDDVENISLGIIGPTSWDDEDFFNIHLSDYIHKRKPRPTKIITGGSNGLFDKISRIYAEMHELPFETVNNTQLQTKLNNIAKKSDYLLVFTPPGHNSIMNAVKIFLQNDIGRNDLMKLFIITDSEKTNTRIRSLSIDRKIEQGEPPKNKRKSTVAETPPKKKLRRSTRNKENN